MALIDKDALVAEIKKYKNNAEAYLKCHHNRNDKLVHSFEQEKLVMCELLSFLNTLEVKEVDLDVMQRMEECPYRQVGCTMYEGKILECNGACSWVVDYPKLKELKAQKNEG